ncbi:MAG TPA: iron export ABC transporter permease subunit FetB [Thermoleophilia bacterium]|nr:iron export ABC transporter permease subunit FetB [Thermoleophilia bacterium]
MTGAEPFGFTSLAAALALVAVALLLSWWQRLDVERDIGLACVRAFVQLMAVGYIIHLILQTDRPLYVALTLAAMLLFAVITSARRARGLPGAWTLAAASIGVASMATLAVMLVLGIIPAGARYVIPIGGMLIGNCMNVASVTAVRLLEDAADRRPQIEASLALGASPRQSTATLARRSVRLAMVPVIDSTKTTGLVFLPGAMTGMILAGAEPLQAVRLQAVVMFMLLAAVALTASIMSYLAPGRLFTPQQQLRRLRGRA